MKEMIKGIKLTKINYYEIWKLICGILIMLAIFLTTPKSISCVFVYLGIGGGGSALIADFFTKRVRKWNDMWYKEWKLREK